MRKLALLVMLGGCSLYWGNNGNGDDVCNETAGDDAAPALQVVDPSTGQCSPVTGGGGGGCGPCEPCALEALPEPDWAGCYGACTDIQDENTCVGTTGCHADYTVVDTPGGPQQTFWKCLGMPPSGPIDGGGCANLDAQSCSEHDDCASDYTSDGNGTTKFASCTDEPDAACSALTCGPGYHCDEECMPCEGGPDGSGGSCMDGCAPTCVPDQTCADVDCGPGSTCAMECASGTCYPSCIPSGGGGPGDCNGMVSCNSAPPQCPANTTAGIANGCYTGYCIPLAQCGPNDPGLCYAQVLCNSAPPQCPMGTLPGVKNGCYSGFCIPAGDCEMAACETISDETTCEARMDCIPVYDGSNCTCTPEGCTCQTLTWERCESAYMPL